MITVDNIIIGIISVLGGAAVYLIKEQINDLKRINERVIDDIDHIKESYFKKADFSEFKNELWARLDRFEADVKEQLNR